jgi:trehalose synthase
MSEQKNKNVRIEEYERFVGAQWVKRVRKKADHLRGLSVAHVNSTRDGGGVAEILSSLTLLMNNAGLSTEWKVLAGTPEFFQVTKKIHNSLQGSNERLSKEERQLYEEVVHENAIRNHIDQDRVIVHDPQPLPLIAYYEQQNPWWWQCHIDLTTPNQSVLKYLRPFIEQYSGAIFSLPEYALPLGIPQNFIMPAIDPFSPKNVQMSEQEIQTCLDEANIPTDLPLIVQISRFDKWKDPMGVIQAFKEARKHIDATLILLGSSAADDQKGATSTNRC